MAEPSSLLRTVRNKGEAVPVCPLAAVCDTYSLGAIGAAPLMIPRIAITLASAGILCSHLITVSERCAQRFERQQLNRAALMVAIEQGAQ